MSNTSGISSQRYLRARTGLVVVHTNEDGKPRCQLRKYGTVLKSWSDDVFATASVFIFTALWHFYRSTIEVQVRDYPAQPAFIYINGFDVNKVLAGFNRAEFEQQLLPAFKSSTEQVYRRFADEYMAAKDLETQWGKLELYDTLVRIFVYLRNHKFKVDGVNWSSIAKVTLAEVFTSGLHEGQAIPLSSDDDPMVNHLKQAAPSGHVEQDGEGKWYYVVPGSQDTLSIIGGQYFDFTASLDWFKDVPEDEQQEMLAAVAASQSTRFDEYPQDIEQLALRVVELFSRPHQKMTETESAFLLFGEQEGLLGHAVGYSALKGLGRVAGVGPLAACIERVAAFFVDKGIDHEKSLKLAAARICKMQSAKQILLKEGVYHLQNRSGK